MAFCRTLQCQLGKFIFCSCTLCLCFVPSFYTIYLQPFLPSCSGLKRTNASSPHTLSYIDHIEVLNSCVWLGLTSHPVARAARLTSGNLPVDKRVCEGPTSLATSRCLSWAPKLAWDDTTHTSKAVIYLSQLHTLWCYLCALCSDTTGTIMYKEASSTDIICRVIKLCDDLGLGNLQHRVGCTDAKAVRFMAAEKTDAIPGYLLITLCLTQLHYVNIKSLRTSDLLN